MSQICANTLCETPDWFGSSTTASLQQSVPPNEAEEDAWIHGWRDAVGAFVLCDPTVAAAMDAVQPDPESDLVTYLTSREDQRRYYVIDMSDALSFLQYENLEQPVSILSLKPCSRKSVTAKVSVRRGRLSLVVPDALEEGK